ncbi:amino acid ABC transporter permease [Clostridium sp. MT-14]|uniref:Amino acid ABC transporter permease n=1 Tax=Clostridium aromativorans TaxID=2836848 RepID=A0ABS8N0K7_9CLOT|nr:MULTISPECIES: amino acid ABC transporter permease [Clostridium]KAA8667374.1 amino acid ABC transporter permease [Clostridium sp. HV4-5-A1G]MCC9293335.1 amino acid ABC transporter permease [Clostridium aromativorans]CAB1252105.1 Amino acid ABC transporter permease [Clostridiaceae bacterium BL-3]
MDKIFDFTYMVKCIPKLIPYLSATMMVTVISMLFGLLVGFFIAIVKIYKISVLRQIAMVYVSFVRGTPLLVQLYLIYFGMPKFLYFFQIKYGWFENINVNVIPPEYYAILAFSVNLGAYLSETIRSSIEAVDRGQFEAANSIGMSQAQIMLKIVLPQALIVAIPNLGNTLISTVKDTSLIFMIGIVDIMGEAKIIGARGLAFFEIYIAVSIIYWFICIILEKCLNLLEKRSRIFERSVV